jgi:predicted metalloprotease with PDZ domain
MARITYTVSMPDPRTRLFHVALDVRGLGAVHVDLALPAWTPGSYKIRDYARNLQDFEAGGRPWRKIDKQTWRVDAAGRDQRVTYRVYANELNVRGLHLNEDHGYFNGAALFLCVDGYKEAPVELVVDPPRGWRVITGLGLDGTRFVAPSYDVLVDSPVECGRFDLHRWKTLGRTHRLAIHGRGNHDAKALVRDIARIVETEAKMFGGLPYDHYTFLLHLTATEGGGGLEHLNSTSLQTGPFTFKPRKRYEGFLELVAHEFFHLWNVKRIHPAGLGPFDYSKEVHTTLLWAMEGVTSYYDWLVPRRAGLVPAKRYLEELASRLQAYDEKPGRRHQSLSESSFDAWTRFYNPNEHTPNSQVSYYEKGAIVALLLDLEIRRLTRNRRSLDDLMRLLWQEWGRRGVGFPEPEYRRSAERVAGASLAPFWRDFVDGRAEIDYARFFAAAGLQLKKDVKKEDGRPGEPEKPWLGIIAGRAGDRVLVSGVRAGSPAERAGLCARDEILAIDGVRVDAESWSARVEERAVGERVRITLFRDAMRRTVEAALGRRANVAWSLAPVKSPTALQKAVYETWLAATWPSKS